MRTKLFVGILSFVVGVIVALITVPALISSHSGEDATFFTCEQYPVFPNDFTDWKQQKVLQTEQTDIRLFQSPFEGGLVREVLTTSIKINAEDTKWHLFVYQYTVNGEICFCIPPPPRTERKAKIQIQGNKSI